MTIVADKAATKERLVEAISAVSKLRQQDYPADWRIVKLGDIVDIQGGSQPPKSNFVFEPKEGYVRLLQIRDFGDKPVPTYVPRNMVTKFCTKEDVFIARYGASLGRIVRGMEGAYNVALAKVIFDRAEIDPGYMFYLLQTPYFQTPIHMISRSAQNGFNKGEVFPIEVPLAPLDQQQRIVAEIEKQFSRLDEAVTNLKRYKAAVLKAAVEGRLTEEWRAAQGRASVAGGQEPGATKAHPDVEPARKLLDRILAERRAKWEETELAKMEAKGKAPKNGKWKAKYNEPVGPNIADLPELPEGWVWATVDQLVAHLTDGDHQPPPQTDRGIPFLVIGNVRAGEIDFSDTRYVGEEYYSALEPFRRPIQGDLLYTLVGSYGIPVRVITNHPFCVQRHIAILRPHGKSPMDYLTVAMASSNVFKQATSVATGTAQKTVPLAGLRRILVSLPPADEQEHIVFEVDRHLSLIRETETQVDTNLKRAERLRQSILGRAFAGALVPDAIWAVS